MKTFLLTLLLISSTSYGESFQPTQNRTLIYAGPIDNHVLLLADLIIKAAITGDRKTPIDLILSSDGGLIETGNVLINAMEFAKASGIKIRCLNAHRLASMGFMIFMHCSERYALADATYMFHYPRVQAPDTATVKDLIDGARDLKVTEDAFVTDLVTFLHVPANVIRKSCEEETWFDNEDINTYSENFVKEVTGLGMIKTRSLY